MQFSHKLLNFLVIVAVENRKIISQTKEGFKKFSRFVIWSDYRKLVELINFQHFRVLFNFSCLLQLFRRYAFQLSASA